MSVDIILGLGDDALENQFFIHIPAGIPGGGNANAISLRADKEIDPPGEDAGVYEFYYRGLKITKPSMQDSTEKTITFAVRVDKLWAVHKDLIKWKRMVHDPSKGTAMDSSQASTTMVVEYLDHTGQVVRSTKYKNVFLKTIKPNSSNHEGTDAMRLNLTFVYQSVDYE